MTTYKVTDPKGITIDGVHIENGQAVSIAEGAQLNAFIHFKQVELVPEKPLK